MSPNYAPTEDTWTGICDPNSTWCPRPELWHAWDDEATELEVTELVAAFVRATQPEYVLETGTYDGQTTRAIAEALERNGHGRLVSIEQDEKLARIVGTHLNGLPVQVIAGNVDDYVPDGIIDFAFIDAGPDRIAQLERLLPSFAQNAVVIIHDTAPHHVVWGHVQPLIAAGKLTGLNFKTPRGFAVCTVT